MEKAAGSKTSVHIGNFTREYTLLLSRDPELATKYTATSLESSMLANRLSWFYDLIGPSVCLDTACSSSLMALHIACQGLRSRESTMVSQLSAEYHIREGIRRGNDWTHKIKTISDDDGVRCQYPSRIAYIIMQIFAASCAA